MLFAFIALTLLVEWQEEHLACKKLVFLCHGGDLTGALHVLYLQL